MKISRYFLFLLCIYFPCVSYGQTYQAGQVSSAPAVSIPRWEVSAGVYRSNLSVRERSGEELFSKEKGLSLRGLYYFSSWFAGGIEGEISAREKFPLQNTYRRLSYGLVTKWVLTPQTQPQIYLLLGGGIHQRKLSYMGDWSHTVSRPYVMLGPGLEIQIGRGGFIGLELQARYNPQRKLDAFTVLKHRWEAVIGLRGGVRF